jgi:hypothetical protein
MPRDLDGAGYWLRILPRSILLQFRSDLWGKRASTAELIIRDHMRYSCDSWDRSCCLRVLRDLFWCINCTRIYFLFHASSRLLPGASAILGRYRLVLDRHLSCASSCAEVRLASDKLSTNNQLDEFCAKQVFNALKSLSYVTMSEAAQTLCYVLLGIDQCFRRI